MKLLVYTLSEKNIDEHYTSNNSLVAYGPIGRIYDANLAKYGKSDISSFTE